MMKLSTEAASVTRTVLRYQSSHETDLCRHLHLLIEHDEDVRPDLGLVVLAVVAHPSDDGERVQQVMVPPVHRLPQLSTQRSCIGNRYSGQFNFSKFDHA